MGHKKRLRLVLCWHMHQPDYRDHVRDEFQAPWVYLHAIKDYSDMAAHVEAVPGARAVFNFSPVLLEQLEDYERHLRAHLDDGRPLNDPLLAALSAPVLPADPEHRIALIKACLRSNRKHMIDRFPAYRRLADVAETVLPDGGCESWLTDQYLADLLCWFHLAWLGETVRNADQRVRRLLHRPAGFTLHERRDLLHVLYDQIAGLRGRYAGLAQQGRIELSVSPFAHPMIPLLLDFKTAREAMPELALPERAAYPDGRGRARWHVQESIRAFEGYFGLRPAGCWPSEGGVSAATLDLLAQAGFRWAATGEAVIRNSIRKSGGQADSMSALCRPHRLPDSPLMLFGRIDELSDLIGFRYADWHADDAVGDLVHRLEGIADRWEGGEEPVAAIIMDGENAWEHYPNNGYYFLSALYRRLSENGRIRLCTFSELVETGAPAGLNAIVSGSWVYGTFSTWIGDPDKNRAWDILVDAKGACDRAGRERTFDARQRDRIDRQLAACEASDWFWWFGNYNPAEAVRDFDRLYRMHLANLYDLIGEEPPRFLQETLFHGGGEPERGGVMRTGAPAPA